MSPNRKIDDSGTQQSSPANSNNSARGFVMQASIANMFEIESSKLACDKSLNPEVRKFAECMIMDHNKAGEELVKTLQTSKSGAVREIKLDYKHQELVNQLKMASPGAGFDKRYIDAQTKGHAEAVKLFKEYAQHGQDAALKTFAKNTLPTLERHHALIKAIH